MINWETVASNLSIGCCHDRAVVHPIDRQRAVAAKGGSALQGGVCFRVGEQVQLLGGGAGAASPHDAPGFRRKLLAAQRGQGSFRASTLTSFCPAMSSELQKGTLGPHGTGDRVRSGWQPGADRLHSALRSPRSAEGSVLLQPHNSA